MILLYTLLVLAQPSWCAGVNCANSIGTNKLDPQPMCARDWFKRPPVIVCTCPAGWHYIGKPENRCEKTIGWRSQ